MAQQTARQARTQGHGAKREAVPDLADDLILERLDGPPPAAPKAGETSHEKARRELIADPGRWMVLNPRATLSEASARRLTRSYRRAKPARLDPAAAGRFAAQPFLRDTTWHVAAVYEAAPVPESR